MTNYDVVKKLIGKVEPIGESNQDSQRYENLLELIILTSQLVRDIRSAADFSDRQESSMKKIGDRANRGLQELLSEISE